MKTFHYFFLCLFFLLATLIFSDKATSQVWNYSWKTCYAYTVCPRGYTISCQVHGSSFANWWGGVQKRCSWFVIPYTQVQCHGYVMMYDRWGNAYWGWRTFVRSCI